MSRVNFGLRYFYIGILSLLAACNGGGSSEDLPPVVDTNSYVVGTAAYGAPMSKASIVVMDKNGKTAMTIADDGGDFKATVTGLVAPLLVTAIAPSGDSLRTYHAIFDTAILAGGLAHANVTPLTEAITAMASSDGKSPEEFADATKLAAIDLAKLAKANATVKTIIKDVVTSLGDPSFDPLTSVFKADRISAGDKLLDTVKVAVDSLGVSFRNIAVPVADSDVGAVASSVVTVGNVIAESPVSLPNVVITDNGTFIDSWVAQVNKCLAMPQSSRVAVDGSGIPTGFLGDCGNLTNFAAGYKRNGYTLLQYWGNQFRDVLPDGAMINAPEVLGFFKNASNEDLAVVRLPYTSPKGAGSYVEVAHKISGAWKVEGNQRNYDAGVGFRMFRQTDRSTNHFVPNFGPDKGKDVGLFSAYYTRLTVSFNQGGPNGADVYAVRVKGPGLPAAGLVLARSTVCGTNDYLANFRNDGVLPSAPASGSVFPLVTNAGTNGYFLGLMPFGSDFTGSDFYNEYRGRNADGSPSTSAFSIIPPTPVDIKSIPYLAAYTFEVFKAGSVTAADTFVARNVAKPLAVEVAPKLSWASITSDTQKYIDPNGGFSGELTNAEVAWTVPAASPNATSAYLFGTGYDTASPPVFHRMNMGQGVKAIGDTSLTVVAGAEFDGNGKSCAYGKMPTFSSTTGYREVGVRRTRVDSVVLQQYESHNGRPAIVK